MKYCPECGDSLGEREWGGRVRPSCLRCGFVHAGRWTVGVGGVVIRDGAVLLTRRAIPPVGLWTVPGGYAECDEPLESAVVREVLEETSVTTTVRSVISVRSVVFPTHLDTYLTFLLDYVDGDPRPDGTENDRAEWVGIADLDEFEGVANFTKTVVHSAVSNAPGLVRAPYQRPKQEPADFYVVAPADPS